MRRQCTLADAKCVCVLQLYAVDFSDPAAGDEMVGQYFFKLLWIMTRFALIGTSFRKTATGFRIDRRSDLTLKKDAFLLFVDVRGGDRGD